MVNPHFRSSKFAFVMRNILHVPQQWLKAAYIPVWLVVSRSLRVSEAADPTSITRVGRRGFILEHALCFLWHLDFQCCMGENAVYVLLSIKLPCDPMRSLLVDYCIELRSNSSSVRETGEGTSGSSRSTLSRGSQLQAG